ncbi:hypothetical protein ACRCQA_30600, partial [Pseudomonas aeruginosa]
GGPPPAPAPAPTPPHPPPPHPGPPPPAPARAAAGTLVVDPLTAKRLRLSAGASVRAVPLSAQKRA